VNPRDTTTGKVHEEMAIAALNKGGYKYETQKIIGQRLKGGKHKVDFIVAAPNGEQVLVEMKWQQVPGTTEQKIPFEIISLADAVQKNKGKFKKAYIVLGGEGWTLRKYYLSGDIFRYLKNCDQVEIISLEAFVAKANQGKL
jgi:hypothetical protein